MRLTKTLFPLFIILYWCGFLLAQSNPVLDQVVLEGLSTLSPGDITKELELSTRQVYSPELAVTIRDRLQQILIRKGFYFATITQKDIIPVDSKRVSLVFQIEEGYAGNLDAIRFSGNRYFSEDTLNRLLNLNSVRLPNLKQLPALMDKVLSLYTERGYLFAEVVLDTLSADAERLSAVIRITEGPLFRPEKYLFTGNKVTKTATLLRISGLAQSRQITPDVLLQAEANLLRKPYIRDCSIVPINENTLGIAITESRMTKIEGVLGLTTNPGSQKRNLNGLVNLQFLNLWGTDRAIALNWRSLSSSYRKLEMTYHESGWNRYPVEADLMFQRTQQDSAWVRIKAELSAYYNLLEHRFGTILSTENLYPDHPDSTVAIRTNYYTGSLFWEYSKTDYEPNPSSGSRLRIKYGLKLSDSAQRTKTVPLTELDAATYIPLSSRLVLAPALHFRELSDKNARPYEQYKLGGFSSLRGYIEDQFSSWRIGWANSELRYLMSRDSRLFLLFDNGFLQESPDKIKADLMAVGAGISVQTRVGQISVSYALSIINGRVTEPSSGLLHMGLASSF